MFQKLYLVILRNLCYTHLAHVQGVSEDENIGVKIVVAESKGKNLEVPDDSHPEEKAYDDHRLISILASIPS